MLTSGILVGELTARELPRSRKAFAYELSIRAPALNNYRFSVLVIAYDLEMYPVIVSTPDDQPDGECLDEESLITTVASVLRGPRVRKAISSLLAQSKA
jgi:hypothetical protein